MGLGEGSLYSANLLRCKLRAWAVFWVGGCFELCVKGDCFSFPPPLHKFKWVVLGLKPKLLWHPVCKRNKKRLQKRTVSYDPWDTAEGMFYRYSSAHGDGCVSQGFWPLLVKVTPGLLSTDVCGGLPLDEVRVEHSCWRQCRFAVIHGWEAVVKVNC